MPHADCVKGLSQCLTDEAAESTCVAVGPTRLGPLASVASPHSVGPTAEEHGTEDGVDGADLTNHAHNARCVANTTVLKACPHRTGYKSFLDEHAFASVQDADTWVNARVAELAARMTHGSVAANGLSAAQIQQCLAVRRDQLCSVHLPVCKESGSAPQRIRFAECQAMWDMCPTVMRSEWGLQSATDCGNDGLFFVRNYVGEDEHTCGYNSTEALIGAVNGRNVPELKKDAANDDDDAEDAGVLDGLSPYGVLGVGVGAGVALCGLLVVAVVAVKKIRGGSADNDSGAPIHRVSKDPRGRRPSTQWSPNPVAEASAKVETEAASPWAGIAGNTAAEKA